MEKTGLFKAVLLAQSAILERNHHLAGNRHETRSYMRCDLHLLTAAGVTTKTRRAMSIDRPPGTAQCPSTDPQLKW